MKPNEGFMISHSDFYKLIDLSKKNNMSDTEINLVNGIETKYSVLKDLINFIRKRLFAIQKDYPEGSDENIKAHDDCILFNNFVKIQQQEIENGNLTYEEYISKLKERMTIYNI